jgi:hypothetical protein
LTAATPSRLLGDRQHRQRGAGGGCSDRQVDLIVDIGLFEQRFGDVRFALIVFGEDHDLAAVQRHRAAGEKLKTEREPDLGLLCVSLQRAGFARYQCNFDILCRSGGCRQDHGRGNRPSYQLPHRDLPK